MDRSAFYDVMRQEFGALSQSQVDGTNALLDVGEERQTPQNHMAYILSTSWHETAFTQMPIAEYGKGEGHEYGEPLPEYNNQCAYGRGYVQLTWAENYEKADRECGLNGTLLDDFELALDPVIAAEIIFEGMTAGWFTGKKLDDYCNEAVTDYYNARRIVNGTDRAGDLQDYAEDFEQALRAASWGNPYGEPPAPIEEVPEGGVSPEDGEHPPETTRPSLPPTVVSRIRYDYKTKLIVDVEEDLESHLNEMGARGWRLSQMDEEKLVWERPRR
jgi:hypothetical protein